MQSVRLSRSHDPAPSELKTALRACRNALIGVGALSCMINLLYLTGSLFMLEIYDRVLLSRSVPTLVGLVVLAGGLYIAQGALDLLRGRILVRIGTSLDEAMSARVCRDAAGQDHRCGRDATSALGRLLGSRTVTCHQVDIDRRYDRALALCSVGGTEINAWLVKNGLATDYRQYSDGAYATAEAKASELRAGNWVYTWRPPADFRRCMKSPGATVTACSAQ